VTVARRTVTSRVWNRQPVTFTETSLAPGTTYTWRVEVSDPDGNRTRSNGTTLTTPEPAPEPTVPPTDPPTTDPPTTDPAVPPAGG
jgi:hypothetical protein